MPGRLNGSLSPSYLSTDVGLCTKSWPCTKRVHLNAFGPSCQLILQSIRECYTTESGYMCNFMVNLAGIYGILMLEGKEKRHSYFGFSCIPHIAKEMRR